MLPDMPSSSSSLAIDRMFHAWQGRFTAGISPAALALAFHDWGVQLANSPGKQAELVGKAQRKLTRLSAYMMQRMLGHGHQPCIEPLPQDRRFEDPAWEKLPFALTYQSFLLTQQWFYNATSGLQGVSPHHDDVVSFVVRQMLDVFSPSNSPLTNPVVLNRTLATGGFNLWQGWRHFTEDWERMIMNRPPAGAENFVVGENMAVTPGRVVYRNHLVELIQYTPTTKKVHAEPVLITPAWIMKYYILDLSPNRSLVEYLVNQGYTVFIISWKNPTASDQNLGMEDYLKLGPLECLETIRKLIPDQKVHTVGYCLGGTVLSIAAATLARDQKDWIQTVTLLAAQTDHSEAGELMLFIDPAQVAYLEDLMWDQGYLDTKQMSGAFQLLRSNDLIWSRMVSEYLMGERQPMIDLMAWNADGTRMPFRMHSEYLRQLFLNNDLAEGRYRVNGRPVALSNIHAPIFAVGTERDHVAPWRSVYKIDLLSDAEVTFLLTSGGHNAGIVSPPEKTKRRYRVRTRTPDEHYQDPDEWLLSVSPKQGSWWPEWDAWLAKHSSGTVPARQPDGPSGLPDAPGVYVLEP